MAKTSQSPALAEQIMAMMVLDAPIPVRVLYGMYGGRTTFHELKKIGLNVRTVVGMGPSVIPSEFKIFLLKQFGTSAPRITSNEKA